MKWTTDKPTSAGRYWYRTIVLSATTVLPQLALVRIVEGDWLEPEDEDYVERFRVQYHGTELDERLHRIQGGEWYGPLEAPK